MMKENKTLGYVLNNDQQRLVEENWEFAAGVARGYAGGCVPMAELESEAWTALCKAAFKYKKVEGCKFTSYAYYFIKGSILKLLKNEGERRTVEVCSVEDDLAEDNLDGDEEWQADDKRLEMLAELMQSLSKREREVVRRYYGVGCEAVTVMELAASTKLPMKVLVMAADIEPLTKAIEMGYVVCDGNGGATWMLGSKTLLAYFLGRVWAADFPSVNRGGGSPVWTKGEGVFPAKALERIFDERNLKELRQGRLYSSVPEGHLIVDRLFITLQ